MSTSEKVDEFRLHRLVWTSPESFLLTGLDSASRFKRVHARFASPAEATQVASTVLARTGIPKEPISFQDEIQVEARFPMSGRELLLQAYAFSIRILVYGFILFILASAGIFGILFGVAIFGTYSIIVVWALIERTRRRVNAWLRWEGKSLTVRTSTSFTNLSPRLIHWQGPETFLLKGSGKKLQLYFRTAEEARQTATRIKTTFPGIRETEP